MRASRSFASWMAKRFSTGSGSGPKRSSVAAWSSRSSSSHSARARRRGRAIFFASAAGAGGGALCEPRPRLAEKPHVELEADRRDVAGLFGAEEVARAADLQVSHGDGEAGPELCVVGQRGEAGPAPPGE